MSWPAGFEEQMRALLGEEAAPFFRAMEEEHVSSLRINPLRPGAEEAARPFVEEGGAVPWCPAGRYLLPGARPGGGNPAHDAGAYYIQEASAMAPAMALDARPGERVLDLCAAPGGKSGQIAAALDGQGCLVSNEPDGARAKALSGNLERLGVVNAVVVSALPEQLSPLWPEAFDRVLVDAPCSGEGMFRRDPEARAQWNAASPAGCAARQAGILDHAATMLRPGGRLVYSTCTFNRLENEGSVRGFLARHPDFSPEAFSLPGIGQAEEGMLRLYPHRLRGEGHFVACLKKAGEAERRPVQPPRTEKPAALALDELVRTCLRAWPERLRDHVPMLLGDRLYALPAEAPALDRTRVIRRGLHLCRVGRGYVEPDHALAMALRPEEAARVREVSDAEAARVMAGEVIDCEAAGWVLICWHGMPLGWGKASGGVLKNHIPKGLRRPA